MADSYIVRIYRRDRADRSRVAGIVVDQQGGEEGGDSFSSSVELLRLLSLTAQHHELVESAASAAMDKQGKCDEAEESGK
jgi:hypothetical protein